MPRVRLMQLVAVAVALAAALAGCGSKNNGPVDCPALTQADTDGGTTFTCPEPVATYCAGAGPPCPTFTDTASLCNQGLTETADCSCYHVAYMQGIDSDKYYFFDSNGKLYAFLGGIVTSFGCQAGPSTFTWPTTCKNEKDTAICK